MKVPMEVRTRLGEGKIFARQIAGSDLLIAEETHAFLKDGIRHLMPRGTPYLRNRELAQRTGGRVTHQIVAAGLYDLWRMVSHVTDGSWIEAQEILAKKQEVRACAEDLLASGAMEPETLGAIMRTLTLLEGAFAEPKRAARKIVASRRLGEARRMREQPDRRKIAPASMAAYAAAHHLDCRMEDLWNLNRFFHARGFRVYLLIADRRETIKRLRDFADEVRVAGKPGSARREPGELAELLALLRDPRKRKNAGILLQHRFRDLGLRVAQMEEPPFHAIAERVLDLFARLGVQAEKDRFAEMERDRRELSRLVMRMRMIDHLESRVVSPVAFYLARTRPKERRPDDPARAIFRERLQEMLEALSRLPDEALDRPLHEEIARKIRLSREAEKQDKLSLAKRFLKEATRLLSVL